MSMVEQRSGCKVGWETYDSEPEAVKASERAQVEAASKALRGYDFGYCVPGEIRHVPNHPEHGDCYIVTIP